LSPELEANMPIGYIFVNFGKVGQTQMKNRKNIADIRAVEEKLRYYCSSKPEVSLVYLFGSAANRKSGTPNDIDVAILTDPQKMGGSKKSPYGYTAHLISALTNFLSYPADVVLLNDAPPVMLKHVISTGRMIFCRNEKERINFEVKSLMKYADTAHLRQIKRYYMQKRLEKGPTAYG
jgi:predicted nucleotidyltransferase